MSNSGSGAAMSQTKSHSPFDATRSMISVQMPADRRFVIAHPPRREPAADELAATRVLGIVHRDHHREVLAVRPGRALTRERRRILLDREHVVVARERPDLVLGVPVRGRVLPHPRPIRERLARVPAAVEQIEVARHPRSMTLRSCRLHARRRALVRYTSRYFPRSGVRAAAMDFRFDDEQVALRDAVRALCQQHFARRDRRRPARRGRRRRRPGARWPTWASSGSAAERARRRGRWRSTPRRSCSSSSARTSPPARCCGRRSRRRSCPTPPPARSASPASTSRRRRERLCHRARGRERRRRRRRRRRRHVVRDVGARRPLAGEPFDPLTPTLAYRRAAERRRRSAAPRTRGRLRLAGTVLAAAQLVGVAQGALDVASAYALERHQFGVPIGSFQAVKHLLADMYVRVELARSATYAAAAIFDDDRAGDVDDRREHGEAARRRGRHRQRADRGAGARRHGLHLGDGAALLPQARVGARGDASGPATRTRCA